MKKSFSGNVGWVLFSMVVFNLTLFGQSIETGFLNRTISFEGSKYPYVVYVPRDYNPKNLYPVILSLHGGGEYGDDGLKHTAGALARAIRLNPERFPAIAIFPQAKANGKPGWHQESGRAALAALDRTVKEFHGDTHRLYLTGYSAGGNGSWYFLTHYGDRFAAALIGCAFVQKFKGLTSKIDYPSLAPPDAPDTYAYIANHAAKIPIWMFHGDADQSVPVEESRKLLAALKAANADVHYLEFPGVPHNSWDPAYTNAEIIEWLFKQRRK